MVSHIGFETVCSTGRSYSHAESYTWRYLDSWRGHGTPCPYDRTIWCFDCWVAGDDRWCFQIRLHETRKRNRNTPNLPVWQHNYFEHVIRDEAQLRRIREYIVCNPLRWAEDVNNPECKLDVRPKSEFDEICVGARRAVPSGLRLSKSNTTRE